MDCAAYRFPFFAAGAFVLLFAAAPAADAWVAATDPAVVTNNDCGRIAALSGRPLIHRSFQADDAQGIPVDIADRISAGDEVIAPQGSLVEWVTGANSVMALGPGGRVRFEGLRAFRNAGGAEAARLDVTLLAGELRIQTRVNATRPESVLVALSGAEIRVTKGDVELFADEGWRAAVLAEQAEGRIRRGAMTGAVFPIAAGATVGASGEGFLTPEDAEAIRLRLPFSFESARAALPPEPAVSAELDAP